MNILTMEHVSVHYGIRPILEDVSMGIDDRDKIGVIGINGTGKSTLLKVLTGLVIPDEGQVVAGNQVSLRYLSQNPEFDMEEPLLEYVLKEWRIGDHQADPRYWTIESDAKSMLNQLELPDFMVPVGQLSGGQKKRASLAAALLSPGDILILDEPTNHLDHQMSDWLESYLQRFNKAVVMVTHDRYFLDSVANKIIEIDQGKLYTYESNYSGYLELKAARMDMAQAGERKRQSILRKELAWVMRGAKARSTKQKARLERYDTLKNAQGPQSDGSVEINALSSRLGKKTIEVQKVSKSYGDRCLFKDFTYIFLRDDRIGIVGDNGAGKSTLLKIITGQLEPDTGAVEMGVTVNIGYFSQENLDMDGSQKVIEYIREVGDYIQTDEGHTSASQMLERFLFTPAMQWERIEKLSGGERRRLQLLRVLMAAPNVLILDEPTNDLDIRTLQILEDYLDTFSGIVIVVSHDRYFLDRVVRRIFAFEEGQIRQYEGGFSDYSLVKPEPKPKVSENTAPKDQEPAKAKPQSRPAKLKFTYKEQKELETIDQDLAALEAALEATDKEIGTVVSDYTKLTKLTEKKEELTQALEDKMERWVYLNDLAEQIELQTQQRKGETSWK